MGVKIQVMKMEKKINIMLKKRKMKQILKKENLIKGNVAYLIKGDFLFEEYIKSKKNRKKVSLEFINILDNLEYKG